MRIPKLKLSTSPRGETFVRFSSGDVTGTALRARGEGESHYEIEEASAITARSTASMREDPPESCSFDVIGPVVDRLQDGLCIVEALGFEFWVDPDEAPADCSKGSWIKFRAVDLTLYI